MSPLRLWVLGMGYQLGQWLILNCHVYYCVHDGCRNPAVAQVPVQTSETFPVTAWVCVDCLHKHVKWETV